MEKEKKYVHHQIHIDWSELDYFGHVNNVSFFKYIQSARVNFWDEIGLKEHHLKHREGPMLASCKCDFKHPLYFPGKVKIQSTVDFVKNTSFSFVHHLFDENDKPAAIATDIMVMYDFNADKKMEIPNWLRNQLHPFSETTPWNLD